MKCIFSVDKELKKIAKNSFYLLLVQGSSYITPILILTYLIKVLGNDGFGKYAFLLSVSMYLQAIIDYGFSFTASRDIARNSENKKLISEIFCSVCFVKLFFAFFVFLFGFIVSLMMNVDKILFFSIFCYVLFTCMTPNWYFQGIERFKEISFLTVSGRLLFCVFVFLFVKENDDIVVIFIGHSISAFWVMSISYYLAVSLFGVHKSKLGIKRINNQIINGWYIFTATFSSMIISNGGIFWLGITHPPSVVGVYASVERIIKAIVGLFGPLTQAAYPVNSHCFSKSFNEGVMSVKRTGIIILFLGFVCSVFVFFLLPNLLSYLWQPKVNNIYIYMLSPWIFFGVANNVFGIQFLSAAGFSRRYSYSFHCSAVFFIMSLICFTFLYHGVGAAIALTLAELLLMILLIINVLAVTRVNTTN